VVTGNPIELCKLDSNWNADSISLTLFIGVYW